MHHSEDHFEFIRWLDKTLSGSRIARVIFELFLWSFGLALIFGALTQPQRVEGPSRTDLTRFEGFVSEIEPLHNTASRRSRAPAAKFRLTDNDTHFYYRNSAPKGSLVRSALKSANASQQIVTLYAVVSEEEYAGYMRYLATVYQLEVDSKTIVSLEEIMAARASDAHSNFYKSLVAGAIVLVMAVCFRFFYLPKLAKRKQPS